MVNTASVSSGRSFSAGKTALLAEKQRQASVMGSRSSLLMVLWSFRVQQPPGPARLRAWFQGKSFQFRIDPSQSLVDHISLLHPLGRFQVSVRVARVVIGIGKGIAMIEEILHGIDRNGKAEAFTKGDFHVGD